MLSKEDNELLTRVGPGTPMGQFMREYWVPAMLSSELPTPDSDLVRVLLLGERLIAFRDTNGQVGLIQNNCPHRGASLFFGRNEEAGLRCVYHGWKFDVDGTCVDMPNEPAESDFKHKVKATVYPTRERGGVVWAYLGPRRTPPELPDLEANMVDEGVTVQAYSLDCNWLQILEGDLDTVHAALLHYGAVRPEDQPAGTFSEYQLRQRSASFEVIDTEGGAAYGAWRPAGPGERYWRIAQWLFPFYSMAPPGVLGIAKSVFCRVPMDDENTMTFLISVGNRRPPPPPSAISPKLPGAPVSIPQVLPNATDWLGRFRPVQNGANDFLIDRALQRSNVGPSGYSGIGGSIQIQDAAMTWGMGPIFDRTKERLGSTDAAVIRLRRRLIASVRAHMTNRTVPPGVDDPVAYRVRSGGVFLPEDADWVEATRELRKAFVTHPGLDPAINGPL
jgi:nitrite reductase/ring-hydroxylating ferredoxin subunit